MNKKLVLMNYLGKFKESAGNQENPSWHEIVEVDQLGSNLGFVFAMGIAAVCTAPLGYVLMRLDVKGSLSLLLVPLLVLLMLVSITAGLCVGVWLVSKWEKPNFSQTTAVTVDAQGMTVEGLGKSPWADILSIERIPGSYWKLMVHTRQLGRISLSMDTATAFPVFDFYLNQLQHLDGVMQGIDASTPIFALYVFSRWRFRLWINLGYLAGAAAVVAMFISTSSDGLNWLVATGLLGLLVPFLVWFLPLTHLSATPAKHVRAFTVRGGRLQSTDGQWDIDLKTADINSHRAHGIEFDFEVVSICSPGSKRLDVGLPVEELTPFLDSLAVRHTPF